MDRRGSRSCAGRGSRCGRSSSIGEQPCSAAHSSSSRRCSCACTWRTRPCCVGVGGDRLEPARGDRADAVRGDADAHARPAGGPGAQRVDARRGTPRRRVAEAPLPAVRRPVAAVPAVAVVGGGQQHDAPGPAAAAASATARRHRVRVVVRRAVGPVVDVVELADGAVARRRAISRVDAPRRPSRIDVRVERAGQREHRRRASSRSRRRRGAGRSARPRRSRWNACECALGIAATATRSVTRASSSARSDRGGADGGVVERDVSSRRVADARSGCARAPSPPGSARGERRPRRGRRSRRPRERRAARRRSRSARDGRTGCRPSAMRSRLEIATPAAPSSAAARPAPRQASSAAASAPRASSHSRTCAGMVVGALGSTSSRAAVTRSRAPGRVVGARRSAARRRPARRGARSSGVVPAWSARPCELDLRAAVARPARVTTPAGTPARATSRALVDVQLDEAAQAREPVRRVGEPVRIDAGVAPSRPPARRRRRRCGRARRRRRAGRSAPREPNVGVLKRAPSSSANEITASGAVDRARRPRTPRGHAERAVEAPAAAHAVQVRAEPPTTAAVRPPAAPTGSRPGRARTRSPPRCACAGEPAPRGGVLAASRPAASTPSAPEPDALERRRAARRGRRP